MSSELSVDVKCIICDDVISSRSDMTALTSKGKSSIMEASEIRGRHDIMQTLSSSDDTHYVHTSCRKSFTDTRKLKRLKIDEIESQSSTSRTLRSDKVLLQWKTVCFLCCKPANALDCNVHAVSTLEIRQTLMSCGMERRDTWGMEVCGRLHSCNDLVAEEALYHRKCYTRFTQKKGQDPAESQSGRRTDSGMMEGFHYICELLENGCDTDTFTLDDLQNHIVAGGFEPYSSKQLKRKLIGKYGSHIYFSEINGRQNVICFKELYTHLISDKWYADRKANPLDECERIVRLAGKIIASGIRDLDIGTEVYPSAKDVTDSLNDSTSMDYVPWLLQILLQELVPSSLKSTSLGQCIVQCARSRTAILPLPLAVAVSIDSVCGSSELIMELSRLGLCSSYDELLRYKQSVLVSKCPPSSDVISSPIEISSVVDTPSPDGIPHHGDSLQLVSPIQSHFTQFVADNVDHDICTIDGRGTFHGMGIISVTAASSGIVDTSRQLQMSRIPRLVKRLPSSQVAKAVGIPITVYHKVPKSGLSTVKFEPLERLSSPPIEPEIVNFSLLWHICCSLNSSNLDVASNPHWSGFMQSVTSGPHGSVAHIDMQPLIDMNPADETCLYSTLLYVNSEAARTGIPVTCVTFDQPLWLKAVDICIASDLDIVCRLGGFHLLMSYLGCIGHIMSGSGLEDILELNYGPNTVKHMMSGKAYDRAVRGHFLVQRAVMALLIEHIVPNSSSSLVMEKLTKEDIEMLNESCQEMLTTEGGGIDCLHKVNTVISKVEILLGDLKRTLSSQSRTAKLVIQYLDLVSLVQKFLIAERSGDWELHLSVVTEMLPVFAACGHQNYAKSARLYIQLMRRLPQSHPYLYKMFNTYGFHSVRRSDRFWAGLSSDLIIEQGMMKSLKSPSGLTHGRGLSESVRHTWVQSMHECASLHMALKSVVGLQQNEAAHTDCGKARMKRDETDCRKIIEWLRTYNPFSLDDQRLSSLKSGLTANDSDAVTCDEVFTIGSDVQKSLDGVPFLQASLKKKHCVKTLSHLSAQGQNVDKGLVDIDPSTLFYRLIILAQRSSDITSYFKYELSTSPCSLFRGFVMNKAFKSTLGTALKQGVPDTLSPPTTSVVVIDGGALLHHVKWLNGVQMSTIINQYMGLVKSRYGQKCIVVFDGYEASIKDHEHNRRIQKTHSVAPDIICSVDTVIKEDQQTFLLNQHNKGQIISLLSCAFKEDGHQIIEAKGDADTDIVSVALKESFHHPVIVAADDTDILVMLLYHLSDDLYDIYLKSQTISKKTGACPCISIRTTQQKIGIETCRLLPAIHAIGGCDSTSGLHGIGKGTVLKKLTKKDCYSSHLKVIQDQNASQHDVLMSGQKLMLGIYGAARSQSLDDMRYSTFSKLSASSNRGPKPEKLPPTTDSANFHIMRAHLQSVEWVTLRNEHLNACDWGWKIVNNKFIPIPMGQPPAPDDILNIIRCKCKTPCSSLLCSCRRNNLPCVTACANCHGDSCLNASPLQTYSQDVFSEDADHGFFFADIDDCECDEVIVCSCDD